MALNRRQDLAKLTLLCRLATPKLYEIELIHTQINLLQRWNRHTSMSDVSCFFWNGVCKQCIVLEMLLFDL